MASYIPPTSSGLVFSFTDDEYNPPASGELIVFRFGLRPIYSSSMDLLATIDGADITDDADLLAFIRSTASSSSNLKSLLQTLASDYQDIGSAIRRIDKEQFYDLNTSVQAFATRDITAFIGAHLPADLGGAITSWYVNNEINLGATSIGEFFKGVADLAAVIDLHGPVDLQAFLSGWDVKNLSAYISSLCKMDLLAFIQSTSLKNLFATIRSVAPVELPSTIQGWDERFLSAAIAGVYGRYDLQALLIVNPYSDLYARISGGFTISKDLWAVVEGTYRFDLGAYISITSPINLSAAITAIVKIADLRATIVPNMIRLKQAIQIALLEHKDLKAVINFQCGYSGYANLGVTFETIYNKLDLSGFVWGWRTADKYGDLIAYINTAVYAVEDKVTISLVPAVRAYTQLRIKFGVKNDYVVFNTLPIFYSSRHTGYLSAYINATPRFTDLNSSIQCLSLGNYTELPDNIMPKSHVLVLKYNEKWQEQWHKFVEIMFKKDGASPYYYFYVDGTNQIYKIDRTRHWTVWAISYDKDDDTMFDRANVRTKFIFNMSNYNKMDEAIKDLIDRVSAYRESNLSAIIESVDSTHLDLNTYINVVGTRRRRWAKYLGATITGI